MTMSSTLAAVDVGQTTESSSSAVSWGPIVAGALAASILSLVLVMVGSGLGLTMVSPFSGESVSGTTFAVSTAIGMVVVQWLSAALGGYLTGRLRSKWVGIHTDEVTFRDTAHGFLAWALSTLIAAMFLGSVLSSIVGAGAQAVSTTAASLASGAAMGAAANADTPSADAATSYFVDSLFRPTTPATPPAAGTPDTASAQASRILLNSATSGEMSPEDKTYLSQLVASRTGLSEADAQARVDATLARVEEAKVQAQQAADTARKASATFALLTALSLVIGAFIASAAAAFGGKQRDDDEVVYLAR